MRWAGEHSFDPQVATAAARWGVHPLLVHAVVAQESGFDPRAYRGEPQIGDASRGLMQLLYKTARSLGYSGPADGLYDVPTNLDLGCHLLHDNLSRTGGDVDAALSAYNGGFRPSLGFGSRLPDGTFRNQVYVDGVREKLRYFTQQLASSSDSSTTTEADVLGSHKLNTPLVVGLALLLVALIVARYFSGGH
jgi:soluble lytic murein transglycosylase-like protein